MGSSGFIIQNMQRKIVAVTGCPYVAFACLPPDLKNAEWNAIPIRSTIDQVLGKSSSAALDVLTIVELSARRGKETSSDTSNAD